MASKKGMKSFQLQGAIRGGAPPTDVIVVTLDPIPGSKHERKVLELFERQKIGRVISAKQKPSESNGLYESKVLSRNHAEIWTENGKVYVQDTKSSNGTFLNDRRLSAENEPSDPCEINDGDVLQFGVDIWDESGQNLSFPRVANYVHIKKLYMEDNDHDSAKLDQSPTASPVPKPQEDIRADGFEPSVLRNVEAPITVKPDAGFEMSSIIKLIQDQIRQANSTGEVLQQLRKAFAETSESNALFNATLQDNETGKPQLSAASNAVIQGEKSDFQRSYESTLSDLQSATEKLDTQSKKLLESQEMVKSLESSLEEMRAKLVEKTNSLREAQSENELLAKQNLELAGQVQSFESTKLELASSQKEIRNLLIALEDAQKSTLALAEAKSRIGELEKASENWQRISVELEQSKSRLVESEKNIGQIDILKKEIEGLQSELLESKKKAEDEIQVLRTERNSISSDYVTASAEVAELANKLQQARDEMIKLESNLLHSISETGIVRDQLRTRSEEFNNIQKQLLEVTEQLRLSEEEILKISSEAKEAEETHKRFRETSFKSEEPPQAVHTVVHRETGRSNRLTTAAIAIGALAIGISLGRLL